MQKLEDWQNTVKETQLEQERGSFDYFQSQTCLECIQTTINIVNDNTKFNEDEINP